MENQLELYGEVAQYRGKLHEALPGLQDALGRLRDEVYKDGALSLKVKRLMSLGISLRAGCDGCIIGQTKLAVEAGATKAEVLETVSVAISMGGNPARTWSSMVIKTLEELGKW